MRVLDRLGIAHANTSRGEMATCPGCGEEGALVCVNGGAEVGLKCMHARCSSAGPPDHPGLRSPVDLVAHAERLEPAAAARKICDWFGLEAPRSKARDLSDDYHHTDADDPRAPPHPDSPEIKPLPFLWLRDFGELRKPPPLRWLLHDIRTGKPFLRAGKCAVLGGDGGVGKGFFWLSLAVCIALGRDLFETFRPAQRGRVAILAGEDDQQEIHHRLNRIANAFALSEDEVEQVRDRVGIFPLAGEHVSLLELDMARKTPQRTPVFEALVKQLADMAKAGGFEWSFIGLDPLARFGTANVESDQATATAFVQALESMAARLPGEPSIGITHHSSAASVGAGRSNLRGVTGLRNAFRLVMLLDAFEAPSGLRGVLLRNDKNNLGPRADPLWLVRSENEPLPDGGWLETAGVLRRAEQHEVAELDGVAGTSTSASREQREQARDTAKRTRFEDDCMLVLECLPASPRSATRDQLLAALRSKGKHWSHHTLGGRVAALLADGRIIDLSGGERAKARQYARGQ
ncbi:MAG: helicase RepA family protein [Myxococcota bacterium]|nr:helicase RepA family protein [Myxococcota bacterium]